MNRRPTEPGKPAVRVRLDGRDKMPSQNRSAAKLKGVSKAAESRPAREPSQRDLDRHSRMQGREQREVEGFKDSTRMKYMQGGEVNNVKGAAKVAQENAAFKRGDTAPQANKRGVPLASPKPLPNAPASKKRGVPVASREPMIKPGGLGMAIKR